MSVKRLQSPVILHIVYDVYYRCMQNTAVISRQLQIFNTQDERRKQF